LQEIEYAAPKTLRHALELLAANGERARVLAGGTDLLVQLRARRKSAELVVDVKKISELTGLSYDEEAGLEIGAAVPCYRIYRNETVAAAYPGLIDAVSMIGGTQIQGRATVGGNLCNSAPSADAVPPLIVLGAVCKIAGPQGTRHVPAEEFCTAPGRNVLQPEELLVSLLLPPHSDRFGASYLRFIPRNEMDIAVVGVGSAVVLDTTGRYFASAKISLASVAPTPVYARAASESLLGKPVSDDSIEEAAELAKAEARPITDMRGTAEQRVHLVGVLVRRSLQRAVQRARGV